MDLSGENYCSMRAITALTRTGAIRVTCALGSIRYLSDRTGPLGAKTGQALARGPRDVQIVEQRLLLEVDCIAYAGINGPLPAKFGERIPDRTQ